MFSLLNLSVECFFFFSYSFLYIIIKFIVQFNLLKPIDYYFN
jgi:hypothetical protein